LLNTADNVTQRLKSNRSKERPNEEINNLVAAAELGRLLVVQRILVHQVIVSIWTAERRFVDERYKGSVDAVEYALDRLERFNTNGKRIDEKLSEVREGSSRIDNLDKVSIRDTQDVLTEISVWADPAYLGLYHGISGLKRQVDSSRLIGEDNFDTAEVRIAKSRAHYEEARRSFDVAHGSGRRIPQVTPLVDEIRCALPGLGKLNSTLEHGIQEIQSGNESMAEEAVRDELRTVKNMVDRCI
jgi:hypothetical protein